MVLKIERASVAPGDQQDLGKRQPSYSHQQERTAYDCEQTQATAPQHHRPAPQSRDRRRPSHPYHQLEPHYHKQQKDEVHSQVTPSSPSHAQNSSPMFCAGCGISEAEAPFGSLLLFDDPEEDASDGHSKKRPRPEDEKRFCSECMTSKKVRVFWPVTSQWYIATVERFDASTGEHLLRYPDGDTEWVRIGEDHTTNACYYNSMLGGEVVGVDSNIGDIGANGDMPGIQGGISFAFSALGTPSMSQGDFGLAADYMDDEVEERSAFIPKGAPDGQIPQRKNSFQQVLNLNRTASSMSSFGIAGSHEQRRHPKYQILAPHFAHSFASRNGEEHLVGLGHPSKKTSRVAKERVHSISESVESRSLSHGAFVDSHGPDKWAKLPPDHRPPYQPSHLPPPQEDQSASEKRQKPYPYEYPLQQQREEGNGKLNAGSPGERDGPNSIPDNKDIPPQTGQNRPPYPMYPPPPSYPGHPSSSHHDSRMPRDPALVPPPPGSHWGPHQPPPNYTSPPNFRDAPQSMYPYPMPPPPPPSSGTPHQSPYPSTMPSLISPATADRSNPYQKQLHPQLVPHQQLSLASDAKHKKAATKAWTKEEDESLLDMVLEMKHPIKWSIIAQNLATDRTGKQCRERYVNHLNPRLKSTDWSPIEDFTIWRLFATSGTQWAKMSKVIPGRTDNGIKNRFHNLKRQLDREEESRLRAPEPINYDQKVRLDKIRKLPPTMKGPIEDSWKVLSGIGMVAAGTTGDLDMDDGPESSYLNMIAAQKSSRFGPFEAVKDIATNCLRCGLFVPSVQCGTEICTKTKWCRACTKVPMHLEGNILRECLNLRKCQDKELLEYVESMRDSVASG